MARLWWRLPWLAYVLLDLWNLELEWHNPVTSNVSHPMPPEVLSELHGHGALWVLVCSVLATQAGVGSVSLLPPCQIASVFGHVCQHCEFLHQ